MGFCNYHSDYVRMYAELSGPLHKMVQVGKLDGRKGRKKKPARTPEADDAFSRLKEQLLGQLGLFLVDPDKGFVLRTDAWYYAVGAVLEQVRDDRSHVPMAFWSRILAEGQRRTWTAREKGTYAICRCSKSSASCTLTNRPGIGIIRCGEYSRRTTTFRGPLDCRPIVSRSYGIVCHALSRG